MVNEDSDWFLKNQKLNYSERIRSGTAWDNKNFKQKYGSKLLEPENIEDIKRKMREKMLCSRKLYENYRKEFDKSLPSASVLLKYFNKSWTEFKKEIFSKDELDIFNKLNNKKAHKRGKYSDEKIFAILQFLGVKTHKDLLRARAAFPDIIPCQKTIHNHFGGYKNLRKMLLTRNLKAIIEKYLVLSSHFRVKRISPYTCRRNGIDIDWAIQEVGSKKKFYELIDFARDTILHILKKEKEKTKNENGRTNKNKN